MFRVSDERLITYNKCLKALKLNWKCGSISVYKQKVDFAVKHHQWHRFNTAGRWLQRTKQLCERQAVQRCVFGESWFLDICDRVLICPSDPPVKQLLIRQGKSQLCFSHAKERLQSSHKQSLVGSISWGCVYRTSTLRLLIFFFICLHLQCIFLQHIFRFSGIPSLCFIRVNYKSNQWCHQDTWMGNIKKKDPVKRRVRHPSIHYLNHSHLLWDNGENPSVTNTAKCGGLAVKCCSL